MACGLRADVPVIITGRTAAVETSIIVALSRQDTLRRHLDVVANNLANMNTTAFKGSRVAFQTMLSQTIRGSVAPGEGRGGINAAQVGMGSSVASIDVLNTQGALNTTGKVTDLAIQGDGYFVMTDGFRQYYTRDGSFDLSADGTLISPATGLKVRHVAIVQIQTVE